MYNSTPHTHLFSTRATKRLVESFKTAVRNLYRSLPPLFHDAPIRQLIPCLPGLLNCGWRWTPHFLFQSLRLSVYGRIPCCYLSCIIRNISDFQRWNCCRSFNQIVFHDCLLFLLLFRKNIFPMTGFISFSRTTAVQTGFFLYLTALLSDIVRQSRHCNTPCFLTVPDMYSISPGFSAVTSGFLSYLIYMNLFNIPLLFFQDDFLHKQVEPYHLQQVRDISFQSIFS